MVLQKMIKAKWLDKIINGDVSNKAGETTRFWKR